MSQQEEIMPEFECPICLNLLCEPVNLQDCNHVICMNCIEVYNENEQGSFDCPICRHSQKAGFNYQINKVLQQEIRSKTEQKFDLQLKQILEERSKFEEVILIYGNHHRILPEETTNIHEWRLFVDIQKKEDEKYKTSDIIEFIQVELHPTFNPHIIVVSEYPFELKRSGWGQFQLSIKVVFNKQCKIPPVFLNHLISFKQSCTSKQKKIKFLVFPINQENQQQNI